MRRIFYSNGSLVTTDEVAALVLEYGKELAKLETSDTVDIPVLHDDGSVHSAQLLIGPASQLVSVDENLADDPDELVTAARDALPMLDGKISALRPTVVAEPLDEGDLRTLDPYER